MNDPNAHDIAAFHARLLGALGEAIIAVDAEGRFTYWNLPAERMLGWRASDVIGRRMDEVAPTPTGKAFGFGVQEILRHFGTYSGEVVLQTKQGEELMAYLTATAIGDGGSLVGFIGVLHDVSDRKKREQQLAFHAKLLDSVGPAVVATDAEGAITYWSKSATTLYGWERHEVLGRHITDVTPANATVEQAKEIFEQLRRGQTWQGEFKLRRKDGSTFLALVRDDPILDGEGRLVGVIGVSEDYTEHKRSEDHLQFQAQLLEAVGQAVFATNVEGRITYWNHAAEELLGWQAADALGRAAQDVLPAYIEEPHDNEPRPAARDHWLTRRDGRAVLVNLATSPVFGPRRELQGFIAIGQDVTAERAIQQRFRDLVEGSPNGVLRTDLEGHILYCNASLATILGFVNPQQLMATVRNVIALYWEPTDRPRVLHEAGKKEPGPVRTRLRHRDGHAVWVEVRARQRQRPGEPTTVEGTIQDLTDQLRREELRRHLSAIVESSAEAIYSVDLEGRILTWNAGAERMFQFAAEEAVGRHVFDLIIPKPLQEQWTAIMAGIRAGGIVPRMESQRRRKDGQTIPVSIAYGPVLDASGKLSAVSVAAHDLTETLRMQEALRQSQSNYQRLVDETPIGIVRVSPEGRFLEVNPAALRIYGVPDKESLMGYKVLDFYADPSDRPERLKDAEEGRQAGLTRMKRLDGTLIWVRSTSRAIKDAQGQTLYYQGSFEDVTSQVNAQEEARYAHEALQKSEARLREAQEIAHIGSFDFDAETGRSIWSAHLYKLFGVDPASYLPTLEAMLAMVHPDDRGGVESAFGAALANSPSFEHEQRIVTPLGEIRHLSVRSRVIRDDHGKAVRVVGTIQDISERKAAEEARARLDAQNREVSRLRELSEMRMQFLNTAAHDLNTPLTPVLLQLATLRHSKDFAEAHAKTLDVLERNIQRFRVLVQDMLDSARLQGGRLKLVLSAVDVGAIMQDAIMAFDEQARQGGLRIQAGPFPASRAKADASKLSQVLYNLISNAIKYSPLGGTIDIHGEANGGFVEVHVRDPGLGLTPEQTAQIFAPFARVHEGVAGVPKGNGLGLYISKGIIEQHGGRMSVQSDGPGKGSRFSFTLPIWAEGPVRTPE